MSDNSAEMSLDDDDDVPGPGIGGQINQYDAKAKHGNFIGNLNEVAVSARKQPPETDLLGMDNPAPP